jgi:hypothetical protein
MVMEIKPPKDRDVERDEQVLRMLIEAMRILGGPRKLVHMRNLTWIPSLVRACYALLLRDAGYTYEAIAEKLGSTKATVQKMLSADPEAVLRKIQSEEDVEIDDHVAGGIAKLAYKEMRRRVSEEEISLVSETAKVLGVDWAVETMTMIKGLDFPVDKEDLLERLKGVKIFNVPIEEILDNLRYPIRTPAELVKEIASYLRGKNIHPAKG